MAREKNGVWITRELIVPDCGKKHKQTTTKGLQRQEMAAISLRSPEAIWRIVMEITLLFSRDILGERAILTAFLWKVCIGVHPVDQGGNCRFAVGKDLIAANFGH